MARSEASGGCVAASVENTEKSVRVWDELKLSRSMET